MKLFPKPPRGGFKVFYADPPWNYSNKRTRSAAAKEYATLSDFQLQTLPVRDIAHDDAVLFLWSTAPFIPVALATGAAWGFEFKTIGFLWAKRNRQSNTPFFGMGNWTRANVEPCLLFTRGRPKRVCAAVPQFIWSPVKRHSEKPAAVRQRIEKLMGRVPRIELFARHETKGWATWGKELLP